LRSTPNLENLVPVFKLPSDRVAQLYAQAPGSVFVTFYDSQGYGGGIVARLHTWSPAYLEFLISYLSNASSENTVLRLCYTAVNFGRERRPT
jgi:hypothetical protein